MKFCLFVCNRGDTMHYSTWTNYGALLHSSMSTTDNTTQYHGGHPIKGVMPSPMLLVLLTPRLVLPSHLRQQMVWLYWLHDRDSMPNLYTINHPTTLHTHTMKPSDPLLLADDTLRCAMYLAGKVAISQHLATHEILNSPSPCLVRNSTSARFGKNPQIFT